MIENLNELIIYIYKEYKKCNINWEKCKEYNRINLKKNLVKNIKKTDQIFNTILEYRIFMRKEIVLFDMELQKKFNIENMSRIETRIKAQNSIEYKIENYIKNHENGEEPINKCFNDLYGIRIIYDEETKCDEIYNFIKNKYPNLKCRDASKGEYKATHIYFKENNYTFHWELQIWNKKDEKTNIESHKEYKQEYAKWEIENKIKRRANK